MDIQRRTTAFGRESGRMVDPVRSVRGQIPEETERNKRERAMNNVDQGRAKLAGGIDRLGDRLERKGRSFENGDGFKRKGGRAIERAGQQVERGAEYLRTHPVDQMRSDVQFKIRERPLTTVAIALGTGYLLGRIFG